MKRTLIVLGLAVVALGLTGSMSPVGGADSSTAPAAHGGGEFTLTVAIPGADGVDRVIDGSGLAITVIGGGSLASPSASAAGPAAPAGNGQPTDLPPIVWIVGIGVVLVVAVVVLRRALTDL